MADQHEHPIFARFYTWMSQREEAAGQSDNRRELLAGARGRVIELGAGNGLNFAYYPDAVDEVVAVEPEPYLRERAREAAAKAGAKVTVVEGTDDPLPAEDNSFDFAVACLVLCNVPDQARALKEFQRVLKPGGELLFYEHVISVRPRSADIMRLADDSGVWPKLAGGCHMARDTTTAIDDAGYSIESIRRFKFNGLPHVLGRAHAPA